MSVGDCKSQQLSMRKLTENCAPLRVLLEKSELGCLQQMGFVVGRFMFGKYLVIGIFLH